MTNAATALRVTPPTLSDVVNDLARKRWLTKRRSVTDTHVVHLRLSRLGHTLTRHIERRDRDQDRAVAVAEQDRIALGMRLRSRRA